MRRRGAPRQPRSALTVTDSPHALKLQYGAPVVRVEYQAEHSVQQAEFALAGLGENRDFLDLLHQGDVQTIHTQEATLEEIFVRVTGRGLL